MQKNHRDEQRQHINISNYANSILDSDSWAFFGTSNKTGLINQIILNSIDTSEASISQVIDSYRNELVHTLNEVMCSDTEKVIELLLAHRTKELQEKMNAFPKEKVLKIRLRNDVYDTLYPAEEAFAESKYYSSLGLYIKALLEEYCRKTVFERERVFYSKIIEIIESDLYATNKCLLQINYETSRGDLKKFIVKPFRLTMEHETTSVYLVGLSKTMNDTEYKAALFRISRIRSIRTYQKSYGSGKITESEKEKLNELILKRGVYFLIDNEEVIWVRLTEEGAKLYRNVKHMRPVAIETEAIESNGVRMKFNCTREQIDYYFFRFGEHAYVEASKELQEKFERKYGNAYRLYHGMGTERDESY